MPINFETAAVTVGTSDTVLVTEAVDVRTPIQGVMLAIEVDNTGGTTLDSFKVQLRLHANGAFVDFLTDADFDSTTNSNMIFSTSVGPQQVVGGTKAHTIVRLPAISALRLTGKVAAGSTTVIVRGGGDFL